MAGDKHKRPRTRVTLVQFVTAVLTFLVLSALGGLLMAGLLLPAATVANSAAQGSASLFEDLPDALTPGELRQQSNIYDRTGKHLLATFYSQNRVVVPLEEISPWIQKAVVAVEDKRYFEHHGVDGQGIVRAVYVNLTSHDSPGGSTLTQQLIKNILLQKGIEEDDIDAQKAATEVSITRKIREWRLALAYEERADATYGSDCTSGDPAVDCGKDQVMQEYLNIAQFGNNLYGVEAAAQVYFGKRAAELNAIEAATIAGVTQNPSKWDPLRHPDNAQKRRNVVLLTMYQQGMITEAEYRNFRATPLAKTLDVHRPKVSCAAAEVAPFFCDYVTKIITKHEFFNSGEVSGKDLLKAGGLTIITTLDYKKQKIANKELRKSLKPKDKSGWAMALVSLDADNGQILAMAQNRDYDPAAKEKGTTSINYAVDRYWGGSRGFSPGSTFKSVVLAEWLNTEHGIMQSVPGQQREYKSDSWQASCLGGNPYRGQKSWKPTNAEGGGASSMPVLRATAFSVNTAYVAMANQMDLCGVKKMAETLGFERSDGADFEVVPSAVLGTQNASPMMMASINQVFANRGVRCEPIALLSITGPDGEEIPVPEKDCKRVIPKEIADGVSLGLQEVMKVGSGRDSQLAGGRPSAGKTGTSQFHAHAWFIGYTPQLVTAVWLGHPDRDVPGRNIVLNGKRYTHVWGSSISAPTWKRYMDAALKGEEFEYFHGPTEQILYGVPREVPNVIGLTEKEAQSVLNKAGFALTVNKQYVYSSEVPPDTCLSQTPSPGSKVRPGKGVTCTMATDQLPKWWYNWPSNWNPNKAPKDYWGNVWPPPEWATNPPNGWNPAPPDHGGPDNPDDPGDGDGGEGGWAWD